LIKNKTRFGYFEFKTPQGEARKLSDYVGKSDYVIIDFWASWCGPCIAEMPFLKKAYEKYKDKGLEIIGISLDNSKPAWEKALKKIDAPWIHLSDLQGSNPKLIEAYHFQSIPHTLILDKTGKIIAVNLRGKALDNWLKEKLD
jgi:thiol-disulfide isomerase/thioredoxin